MTSEERKEARYQRRKAKRLAKLSDVGGKTFADVFSFGNLVKAGKECCKGVRWKTSTILFETFLLQECFKIKRELESGESKFKGFHSFKLVEHGKERSIDALPIRYRAAQKCFIKNLLHPLYARSFIYDNSASLEGKGMDFALRRLRLHLARHYRKYGLQGGIYQFDFKNFFASILHSEMKQRAVGRIEDSRLYHVFCQWVDDFKLMKTFDKKAQEARGGWAWE